MWCVHHKPMLQIPRGPGDLSVNLQHDSHRWNKQAYKCSWVTNACIHSTTCRHMLFYAITATIYIIVWITVKNIPTLTGNKSSLFIWLSTQSMSSSMYWGAGNFVGFLYVTPSHQWYSYLQHGAHFTSSTQVHFSVHTHCEVTSQ